MKVMMRTVNGEGFRLLPAVPVFGRVVYPFAIFSTFAPRCC